MKIERHGINPDAPPKGEGWVERLAAGHGGCICGVAPNAGTVDYSDCSPNQHAVKHFHAAGHPIAGKL
jgi:hypothetical protein